MTTNHPNHDSADVEPRVGLHVCWVLVVRLQQDLVVRYQGTAIQEGHHVLSIDLDHAFALLRDVEVLGGAVSDHFAIRPHFHFPVGCGRTGELKQREDERPAERGAWGVDGLTGRRPGRLPGDSEADQQDQRGQR
jgi:hypothetical protein